LNLREVPKNIKNNTALKTENKDKTVKYFSSVFQPEKLKSSLTIKTSTINLDLIAKNALNSNKNKNLKSDTKTCNNINQKQSTYRKATFSHKNVNNFLENINPLTEKEKDTTPTTNLALSTKSNSIVSNSTLFSNFTLNSGKSKNNNSISGKNTISISGKNTDSSFHYDLKSSKNKEEKLISKKNFVEITLDSLSSQRKYPSFLESKEMSINKAKKQNLNTKKKF